MATELRTFDVSTPAGTTQAAPQTAPLTIPERIVRSLEIRVPPGPRGELGWYLASGGFRVWPISVGSWIATDDEVVTIPTDATLTSGAWQLVSYNTGAYPHVVTVRFFLDPVAAPQTAPVATLPPSSLSGAVTVGSGGAPVPGTGLTPMPFVPPLPVPTAASDFAVPSTSGPLQLQPPS